MKRLGFRQKALLGFLSDGKEHSTNEMAGICKGWGYAQNSLERLARLDYVTDLSEPRHDPTRRWTPSTTKRRWIITEVGRRALEKGEHVRSKLRAHPLIERIQKLENEKESLRLKLWRQKGLPSTKIAYAFLFLGGATLVSSIVFFSKILAFIGLSLLLWGGILLFIKPVRFVRPTLIDSTVISSLITIDRLVKDLDYEGKAVYLPPTPYFLKGYKGGTVYIHSARNRILPPVEELAGEKVLVENPKGICLVPPGLGLVNLYEEELGKDFIQVDLEYLMEALPKLFVTNLEIASDFRIEKHKNSIHIKITGSVFKGLCEEAKKRGSICDSFGCPLCSSIACALTRTLGKPIMIEKTEVSPDGNVIEAYYSTIEE